MGDVTRILADIEQGDPRAAEQLLPLVYDELRKLAAQKMAQENPGQTLQATALVHEAWLRLTANQGAQFQNRAHFFAARRQGRRSAYRAGGRLLGCGPPKPGRRRLLRRAGCPLCHRLLA